MRGPIMVFGCTLTDGTVIDCSDMNIISIRVWPNKQVQVTYANEEVELLDKEWVSYEPRGN